jgi:hypothetical protein
LVWPDEIAMCCALARRRSMADAGGDGKLDRVEFSVAMWLINLAIAGSPLPTKLPPLLVKSLQAGGDGLFVLLLLC